MTSPSLSLLLEAKRTLGVSDEELAHVLGVSRRSISRYVAGGGFVYTSHYHALARAVHPRNPDLAARLAAGGGTTLQALGLAPQAGPPVAHPAHADAVVYAAADALDVSPRQVRPAVLAAFARAKELGLSVDMLVPALAQKPSPAKR